MRFPVNFAKFLTLNMLEEGGEGDQFDSFGFSKIPLLSRERFRPWFLMTFNIIISDIFSCKLHWNFMSLKLYEHFLYQY